MSWVVYVAACADASLYVGISNDLVARVRAHNAGTGARYTRSRRPIVVVWQWWCGSSEEARRLEGLMKRLPRRDRLRVVDGDLAFTAALLDRAWSRMRDRGAATARAPRRTRASAAPAT